MDSYSEKLQKIYFFLSNYYPVPGQHGRPIVNSFITYGLLCFFHISKGHNFLSIYVFYTGTKNVKAWQTQTQ